MGIGSAREQDSCHKPNAVVRHGKGDMLMNPNLALIRDRASFSDIITKRARICTEILHQAMLS